MSRDDYNALPGVRWSRLKAIRQSPKQYRYEMDNPRDETKSLRMGLAVHCLVLEPENYHRDFAAFNGDRRGKAWAAFKAEHEGKVLLNGTEAAQVLGAAHAVKTHPLAAQHLHGAKERAITWTDPETGLECKARVDCVNGRLCELKTAADINPARWDVQCHRYGYFGQVAFYSDGIRYSGHGFDQDGLNPVMIVVHSEQPHDVIVYELPEAALDHGRREYRRCLDRLAECLERDEWPGMAPDVRTLLPPAWAEDAEDDAPITVGGVAVGF